MSLSANVEMSSGSPPTKQYFTDSYVFNWNNQTFRADLILILPVAICLAAGLCIGRPGVGMIAAGGAMTAGFGAKQSIDGSRLLPMVFVSLMHGIRRFDCSGREVNRDLAAEGYLEEGRCRGSAERIKFGVSPDKVTVISRERS